MTNREAIKIIENYDVNVCGYCHQGGKEIEKAFQMAIKALEREVPEVSFSFEDFQEICYFGEDANEDGFWKQTCRRKDMIPSGHSWGVCDKEHCPYVNK